MGPRHARRLVALSSAALLAGCAGTKPPPAVTAFAREDCAAAPDLAAAVSLTPEKPKMTHMVSTPVKADSPCLRQPGGATPYVVYALPADPTEKSLIIGGTLEGARIVSPEVVLLDREGRVVRAFQDSDYFFRGPVYSVQFEPRVGEAYALVTVKAARVGQRYESIAIGTDTTSTYAAGATFSVTLGVDNQVTRTFSYEGSIQATVFDKTLGKKH